MLLSDVSFLCQERYKISKCAEAEIDRLYIDDVVKVSMRLSQACIPNREASEKPAVTATSSFASQAAATRFLWLSEMRSKCVCTHRIDIQYYSYLLCIAPATSVRLVRVALA